MRVWEQRLQRPRGEGQEDDDPRVDPRAPLVVVAEGAGRLGQGKHLRHGRAICVGQRLDSPPAWQISTVAYTSPSPAAAAVARCAASARQRPVCKEGDSINGYKS